MAEMDEENALVNEDLEEGDKVQQTERGVGEKDVVEAGQATGE